MQKRTGNPPAKKKPARVVLPASQISGLPDPGSPFAGISKTNAPARRTEIPNLTAQVAIAKARKQRLTQGGLLSPEQRAAEQKAAKVLAKPAPQTPSKPSAKKPAGVPTPSETRTPAHTSGAGAQRVPTRNARQTASPTILPLPSTAPFKVPPPRAPAPSSTLPPPGRRGTLGGLHPPQQAALPAPTSSVVDYLKGPALGSYAKPVGHAIDLGLGTTAATALAGLGIGPSSILTAKVNAPGALKTSEQAASQLAGAGLSLPKTIPSVDLVAPAGAASTTMTPQKLVAAGLDEKQTKKFRALALKKGWYKGEIDGLVGLDLIKHAYSSPPPKALRIAQNFGTGVIRTGALANVVPAVGQEIASGHGMRALGQIGDALTQQGGAILENPGQAFVSDPYGTVPIAGGALKTLGGVAGKALEKAGTKAVERTVTHAATGATINRGLRSRNLYTASGQMISDAATARSPRLSRRADAQSVDRLVADIANGTAPAHHAVQVPYAKAFKSVGPKRAAVLASINKAGGTPEKILAKYTRDGNKRQIKHWTSVVEAKKNLSEKDQAFLAAHRELGAQTTGSLVEAGRFGETAGIYRAHQPLILSDAHAGDPAAQRVQALHEEWVKTLRTTDDPAVLAPLHGAYDHAVREYAQTHLDAGGIEPTRVAYTKPPSTGVMQPQYRKGTGGKVRFNPNYPKQKASMGGSFESGDYLIDPKVALQENLQAQRIRTSIGLSSDESYAKVGGIAAEKGDPRPPGMVFTPRRNAATVGKVVTDLNDAPVGAHDYYHQEASIRDRLAEHLKATKNQGLYRDETGEYAGEAGWFVPEGSFNRILDYTRPESRAAYDKAMRQYQRVMISIFPSTMLGNTVGSVPLALAAGAGAKSFAKARESSSFRGDVTLVPHSLHGRGVAGSLASDARNPISRQLNRNRRVNVIGEDFSRDAAYFSQALRGSKKRSRELGYEDVNSYLRDMASGKVDTPVRDAAIAHAIKFAGDAAKPMTKTGKHLGRYVLFPQWLQHMTKLMLVTLPVHHPRRMALINALALYGDQYRKEHGVLPSWMQEFAPLFKHVAGGDTFTRVAGLGQFAPQGTAGSLFDTLSQGNLTWPERITGLLNPPVAAAVNAAVLQPIRNQGDYPVDLSRYALNQFLGAIPGERKAFPQTGMEGDSLPWDPRPFHYTDGSKKTKWHDNTLPLDQRPGVRPLGGIWGFVARAGGVPLYDVPAPESKINKATVEKAIKKAQPKAKGWGSWG